VAGVALSGVAFAEILQAGGHRNSLGRSAEVLAAVQADPSRLVELFACVGDEDAWVRMRAIDTFEKAVRADPTLGAPYVEALLALTDSEQPSIQWHLAQLFSLLALSEPQRARVVAWLRDRLTTTEVDWIVAANAMLALVALDPSGARPSVEVQLEHRSASVRRKAAALLDPL
jgi:DNA-binding transcriptional ArsR family regulator